MTTHHHTTAEVELRRKLHDIADHLHRNPNTLSIHRIPQALDLIVTALASRRRSLRAGRNPQRRRTAPHGTATPRHPARTPRPTHRQEPNPMTFAIRVIICDGCGQIIDKNPPKGDSCGGFTNKGTSGTGYSSWPDYLWHLCGYCTFRAKCAYVEDKKAES